MGAAAKVVGGRGRASTDMSMRKCQLRGGYAIPRGDDSVVVGPGEIMLDQDTARAHKHALEHPDDEEFLRWLGVEFVKTAPPPTAQELLMQARQLTERAETMLRAQAAAPAKKN
jgi:hypothetical protein